MDVVTLSRLQFALTSMFHFLFVPLTLGLSVLLAFMETKYVLSGDTLWLRLTKFWGKLFLINFTLGIVTGITLEFQFGMNWAEYSRYVGDIFGAPLAIESIAAFSLESTFIGLWAFGWDRVSKRTHAAAIWIIAFATIFSGFWILLANGWMQHPVGFVLRNNRAEMTDFLAMILNPYGLLKFFHTIFSGYVVAAFFVMGISAYHLLHKDDNGFFRRSFRVAAAFGLASSLLVFLVGDFHAAEVAKTQPAKFAAMESQWESRHAAPYHFLIIPDVDNERNIVETISIPKMLSFLAFHDGEAPVMGLKEFPKADRPPVLPVHAGFRVMAGLGMLFMLLSAAAVMLARTGRLESSRGFLRIMLLALPLPYIAVMLGWIVAEMGRQPWLVYGVLRTADGISRSNSSVQVMASLIGFTALYGILASLDLYLLVKFARMTPPQVRAEIHTAMGNS